MEVRFFGGYDPAYPRNAILRRGLSLSGVRVSECRVPPGGRFWARYALLLSRWLSLPRPEGAPPSFILVPEFGQKDVPLAKSLASLTARKVIFDPLAARFETKILDWRRKPEGSLAAWWNKAIDRLAFRLSDLVIADTAAHREYYCRAFGLSPQKVAVVPVGFDDRIFSSPTSGDGPPGRNGDSPFTVLFFGSFLPLHGVEFVIEAAARVEKEDPSIRFHLIGSGQTWDRVRRQAVSLEIKNVTFEGWLRQPELVERIYGRADVCLGIFGRTEKAVRVVPHKIFQAMALGKPVITSRTPAAEEFFSDGKNIIFCPKGNPDGLARSILGLKKDTSLREEIARNGQELVRERFEPRALGAQLKEILEREIGLSRDQAK